MARECAISEETLLYEAARFENEDTPPIQALLFLFAWVGCLFLLPVVLTLLVANEEVPPLLYACSAVCLVVVRIYG